MARHAPGAPASPPPPLRCRLLAGAGCAALSLLLLAPSTARAEENRIALHFEIGPLIRLAEPSNIAPEKQGARASAHLQLAFEYSVHDRLGLEFVYSPDVIVNQFGDSAQLQQSFRAGIRLRPFLGAGYLYPRDDPDEPIKGSQLISDFWIDLHGGVALAAENAVMIDGAIGTRAAVVWPLQLGLYLRYQQLFPFTGGLEGTWAQITAGVEASAGFLKVHPDPDEDDDGVPDARDRCLKTPPDTVVNEVGCPRPKDYTPPPRCSDTDLDGVCDGQDSCPETPLGTKVEKNGCPPEPDAEGTEAPAN